MHAFFHCFCGTLGKTQAKKEKKASPVSEERVALQKVVDEKLIAACEKVEFLPQYLHAKFTLEAGQYPHAMKF